jgi:hypothetical protein
MPNKKVRGSVVSATDSGLVISAKSGQVSVAKSDIKEVKVSSESARIKKGAINGAIGAGGGVATAAILDGALTDGNGMSGAAAVFFGVIGGAAGFVIGMLRPGYKTIYKDR